jgi:hypothetical protein
MRGFAAACLRPQNAGVWRQRQAVERRHVWGAAWAPQVVWEHKGPTAAQQLLGARMRGAASVASAQRKQQELLNHVKQINTRSAKRKTAPS